MTLFEMVLIKATTAEPAPIGKAHPSREIIVNLSGMSNATFKKFKWIAKQNGVKDWDDKDKRRVMLFFPSTAEATIFKIHLKNFKNGKEKQ